MVFVLSPSYYRGFKAVILIFVLLKINRIVQGVAEPSKFQDTPGIINTALGHTVTLVWSFKERFNTESSSARLELWRKSPHVLLVKYARHRCIPTKQRFSCIIPTTISSHRAGFKITGVEKADQGYYIFKGKPSKYAETYTDTAIMIIIRSRPVMQILGSKRVKQHDVAALTCRAKTQTLPPSFRNTEVMTYTWTFSRRPAHYRTDENELVIYKPTEREDGIIVTCTARDFNAPTDVVSSISFTLAVLAAPPKPELLSVPKRPLIRSKDKLSVTCRIKAAHRMAEITIIWRNLDSSFNTTGGSVLNVAPVSPELHDGHWECLGNNSLGEGLPAYFEVTVNAPPIVLKDPSESYSIVHTKALYIKCQIIAKPAANVTWIYDDDKPLPLAVSHLETHVTYARVYTMTISVLVWNPKMKVDYHNRSMATGKYRCTANNSVGFAESKETSLTMYGGYQFCQPPPQLKRVHLGANISVTFCLSGYPFRTITSRNWMFKPRISFQVFPALPRGVSMTLKSTDRPNRKLLILDFHNVKPYQYGVYTLSIRNRFNKRNLVHHFKLIPLKFPLVLALSAGGGALLLLIIVGTAVGLWKAGTVYTGDDGEEQPADPDAVQDLEEGETETTDTEAEDWDTEYRDELDSYELQEGEDWDTEYTEELDSDELGESGNERYDGWRTESEEGTKGGELEGTKKR